MAALIQPLLSPLTLTKPQLQVLVACRALANAHREWLQSKADGSFTGKALPALARAGRIHHSRLNGSVPALRALCQSAKTLALDGAFSTACVDAAYVRAQRALAVILDGYDAGKRLMDEERMALAIADAVEVAQTV